MQINSCEAKIISRMCQDIPEEMNIQAARSFLRMLQLWLQPMYYELSWKQGVLKPNISPAPNPCPKIKCPGTEISFWDFTVLKCVCPPVKPCAGWACIAEQEAVYDTVTRKCGCRWIPGLEPYPIDLPPVVKETASPPTKTSKRQKLFGEPIPTFAPREAVPTATTNSAPEPICLAKCSIPESANVRKIKTLPFVSRNAKKAPTGSIAPKRVQDAASKMLMFCPAPFAVPVPRPSSSIPKQGSVAPVWNEGSSKCACEPILNSPEFICLAATTCFPGFIPRWESETQVCRSSPEIYARFASHVPQLLMSQHPAARCVLASSQDLTFILISTPEIGGTPSDMSYELRAQKPPTRRMRDSSSPLFLGTEVDLLLGYNSHAYLIFDLKSGLASLLGTGEIHIS
ncbi:hypothetical protein B0O99DRAFT_671580 [Bisporella sp. PMI_857]|nr:hypothetical protein B0O99DRAFT_671580 [Bisporella sp. PMI_857]